MNKILFSGAVIMASLFLSTANAQSVLYYIDHSVERQKAISKCAKINYGEDCANASEAESILEQHGYNIEKAKNAAKTMDSLVKGKK